MPYRLLKLFLALAAYGLSMAMMLQSGYGLMPWDVLHQGIALQGNWPMGRVTVAVSFMVLLAWIPIRQKPGFGTICNAILVGLTFDAVLQPLAQLFGEAGVATRLALLAGGIALNGAATAAYLGADFGAGPRDGLMTGLVRRSGRSVRLVRTLIEGGVLAAGYLLGGALGIGTVLYMLLIGPLIQVMLPWFARQRTAAPFIPAAGSPATPPDPTGQ